jgi:hypothetical protein
VTRKTGVKKEEKQILREEVIVYMYGGSSVYKLKTVKERRIQR